MAMISDTQYVLHAIRLSALRTADDSVTPRIIALDPSFALNPYITAMGLEDIDRFPEIKRALDSPPPVPDPQFERFGEDVLRRGSGMSGTGGATGLRYTQTIMGGRSGGAGMRVSGRRADAGDAARRLRLRSTERRANSSSHDMRPPVPRGALDRAPAEDTFLTAPRPRSDSAPMAATAPARDSLGIAMGMGMPPDVPEGLSVSVSDASAADTGEDETDGLKVPSFGAGPDTLGYGSSIGGVLPSDPSDAIEDPLAGEAVDEGSDVDEDEVVDEDEAPVLPMPPMLGRRPSQALRDAVHYGAGPGAGGAHHGPGNRVSVIHEEERRSSTDTNAEVKLEFHKVVPVRPIAAPMSALTEALKPRLDAGTDTPDTAAGGFNPYGALYALVAAPPSAPSLDLELFFPHSEQPSVPLQVTVRKDATVEEVTGHGLFRYWEEGREPRLEDQSGTVNWGLRIVEDDGEVDEDFPALDRESQISKFSYGQFGIVEATETQKKQNAAMAPLIQRRPSRVDLSRGPALARPQANAAAATTATTNINNSSANPPATADEILTPKSGGGRAPPVLLRVRVSAGADVNFTTTISVPGDMYIADLTEVLVERKQLQQPSADWVLCLADLSLALPLDRTVASLGDRTDLVLVRRQWAVERGLRTGVRGGDPTQSIFKRSSEPIAGVLDFGPKKWTVQRKTPIGRHERVLCIDGDNIHIMPSENRGFFDTMKSTSFHITLVASCKLSGRGGNPGFKIYVWRDASRKRYEFEAENGKQAAEIIACIKALMKRFQAERNTVLAPMRTMSRGGAKR